MTAIDIAEMPVSEKLKLMEALWDSLSAPADGSFESPAWHEQALKQAEGDLAGSTARFVDWVDAKEQLRKRGQA
ncbi:addiction module protein [Sulfuritalea sp.]|uniref:addiction module protein n=1 Tax=Sulfuritalea sp. TaxID=2480090 RepID=UPI00286EAA58|nr:addiction module protein [Sulfuritalea sp.]